MTLRTKQPGWSRQFLAVLSAFAIGSGDAFAFVAAAGTATPQAPVSDSASLIPADQLDSLVAPVALYPDPLLAQVLAASTYPLELIQLQQWLESHSNLQGKALADAVAKQPWDPSIQAMAGLPDLVKRLANDITWTTDLGNAFLAQQSDVMNAVQRMRQKAEDKGALKTTEQQTVTTTTENNTEVIVIEQAEPEVIYVPSYNPTVVWGAPVYPYPPIYYPPYGSYAATAAISFGVGVAMGAFWGGGGWGWNCGWGGNQININNFNNFNRNANVRGGNTWQHNASHRGGTPYRDRATANKFGGTARGDSLANRQSGARQQLNRQGGQVGANRPGGSGGPGGMNRGERGAVGTGGSRVGGGVSANRPNAGVDRGSIGNRPGSDRGNLGSRPGSGSGVNRPTTLPSGGADRIGSRDVSRGSGSGAFNSGGGFDGARARSSSSRGSSSMRSSGGGGSRGGGGRSRGGGGRR
jgi:hypothetical protein